MKFKKKQTFSKSEYNPGGAVSLTGVHENYFFRKTSKTKLPVFYSGEPVHRYPPFGRVQNPHTTKKNKTDEHSSPYDSNDAVTKYKYL